MSRPPGTSHLWWCLPRKRRDYHAGIRARRRRVVEDREAPRTIPPETTASATNENSAVGRSRRLSPPPRAPTSLRLPFLTAMLYTFTPGPLAIMPGTRAVTLLRLPLLFRGAPALHPQYPLRAAPAAGIVCPASDRLPPSRDAQTPLHPERDTRAGRGLEAAPAGPPSPRRERSRGVCLPRRRRPSRHARTPASRRRCRFCHPAFLFLHTPVLRRPPREPSRVLIDRSLGREMWQRPQSRGRGSPGADFPVLRRRRRGRSSPRPSTRTTR